MNTEVTTDFEKHTFQAKREFNAPLSLVWRAFTEKELLDQWWAPKPWRCETKSLDFRPEGKWIYDMVGVNGERHGAVQIFDEIVFENYFSGIDAFTDENGNINATMPVAKWKNSFLPTTDGTKVITRAVYPSREALEFVIKMGMDKGVAMAQDNLAELLEKIKH